MSWPSNVLEKMQCLDDSKYFLSLRRNSDLKQQILLRMPMRRNTWRRSSFCRFLLTGPQWCRKKCILSKFYYRFGISASKYLGIGCHSQATCDILALVDLCMFLSFIAVSQLSRRIEKIEFNVCKSHNHKIECSASISKIDVFQM